MSLGRPASPLLLLVGAGLLTVQACKKEPETEPDAGQTKPDSGLIDDVLRLSVDLPNTWKADPSNTDPARILDARRSGDEHFVAPRLVVSRAPDTERATLEGLQKEVVDGLKSQEGIKIIRLISGERTISGWPFKEVEVSYDVAPESPEPKRVTQRTFVTLKGGMDGKAYILTVLATYMSSDEPSIGPEVNRILATLSFHAATAAVSPTAAPSEDLRPAAE